MQDQDALFIQRPLTLRKKIRIQYRISREIYDPIEFLHHDSHELFRKKQLFLL